MEVNDEDRAETTNEVSRRVRLETLDDWLRSIEKEKLNLPEKGGEGGLTC